MAPAGAHASARSRSPLPLILLLWPLLLSPLAPGAAAQGLAGNPPDALGASTLTSAAFAQSYRAAKDFARSWTAGPAVCSKGSGLCAAAADKAKAAQLIIAASPEAFDARRDIDPSPISPPGDQGICNACVGFSVLAAAEAAVASALHVPGASVRLSVQDFLYCRDGRSMERSCNDPWQLSPALERLRNRPPVADSCLPWMATEASPEQMCAVCKPAKADANAARGRFSYNAVRDAAAAQRAIRESGGVLTSMQVDVQHMRAHSGAGTYDCSGAGGNPEGHAVFVVGYSNNPDGSGHWLVKQSYGSGWGDGGFMRVAYGSCGILGPSSTYQITWSGGSPRVLDVKAAAGRQGCYVYISRPHDYMFKVAQEAGILLNDLLIANPSVANPSNLQPGTPLLLCNPKQAAIRVTTGTASIQSPGPRAQQQQQQQGEVHQVLQALISRSSDQFSGAAAAAAAALAVAEDKKATTPPLRG